MCPIIILFLLAVGSDTVYGAKTYISHVQNYINLVSAYIQSDYSVVDLPPSLNVNDAITIQTDISLYAINGFDEVAGNIELVAGLRMEWQDQMHQIHSISFDRSGKDSFMIPYDRIWTPKLILTNAIGETGEVGGSAFYCRYNMTTNRIVWKPRVLISGSCTPDVTYYPFDKQTCEFIYTAWEFTQDELVITTATDEWDTTDYGESGEWDISSTGTETFAASNKSYIKFSLTIIRKPLYFAFNILLPVLVLCLLNSTVFLLPAESGERVGFSVTCFLSFMVLLNMIMDIMPRSSNPISFLCYYLVVMMCNSGAMTLVTILLMRVYFKPEKSVVPKWLQRTVTFINCGCARLRCCVLCFRYLKSNCSCKDKRLCGCRNKRSRPQSSTTISSVGSVELLNEISVEKFDKQRIPNLEQTVEPCSCCPSIFCQCRKRNDNKLCGQTCYGCVIGIRKSTRKPGLDDEDELPRQSGVSSCFGCFQKKRKVNAVDYGEDNASRDTEIASKEIKVKPAVQQESTDGEREVESTEDEVKPKQRFVMEVTTKDLPQPIVLDDAEENLEKETDSLADLEEEVTWPEVGRICDTFFFLAFLGGQIFFTVVFLIPLFTADSTSDE